MPAPVRVHLPRSLLSPTFDGEGGDEDTEARGGQGGRALDAKRRVGGERCSSLRLPDIAHYVLPRAATAPAPAPAPLPAEARQSAPGAADRGVEDGARYHQVSARRCLRMRRLPGRAGLAVSAVAQPSRDHPASWAPSP